MPNTHHIKFAYKPGAPNVSITPNSVQVSQGDDIEFEAPSDTSITIYFPPTRDPLGDGITIIQPNQTVKRFVSGEKGIYAFAVYFNKYNMMFLFGGVAPYRSGPEMIIQ